MRKAHPYEVVAHDIFHLENRHHEYWIWHDWEISKAHG